MDLFEAAGRDDHGIPLADIHSPLAVRMRPQSLDEVLGQDELLASGAPLRRLIEEPAAGKVGVSSVVLWGPPGTGKTTLAYLVARQSGRRFVEISAVSAGVKEVREAVTQAKRLLTHGGEETVLFIDEVHRFSKSQQDALLPAVENRWVTLIAATTENPSFSVISPLLSRSLLLTLRPLETAHLQQLIDRALSDERGFGGKFQITDSAKESLLRLAGGDARRTLTLLEAAAGACADAKITDADVSRAADKALVRYDQDQHYDVASAFIKSMRGSDPDAAVHYLARMIEAGEDPRFIARRIVIAAAEDVGMADPNILVVANAAAQAVAYIGMPEARIILSEAAIAVATAPKSNAAYLAIDRALSDIRKGDIGAVPPHLRDAHYAGAKKLGHGQDYLYAHDFPRHIAPQSYLPEELADRRYYDPSDGQGFEAQIQRRLEQVREITNNAAKNLKRKGGDS